LLLSDALGLAIQFLGGLGMPPPMQQPTFVPWSAPAANQRSPVRSAISKASSNRVVASSILHPRATSAM
jgi:hypothetical protein